MAEYRYSCEILVVGWGLDALLRAHQTGAALLLTKDWTPHPFEEVDNSYSCFGYSGAKKLKLYNFLLFNLAVAGRAPLARNVSSYRDEDGALKVVSKNGNFCFIDYKRIMFVEPKLDSVYKIVLDWINVRQGMKHNFDNLKSNEKFIRSVYFYYSDRVDGARGSNYKDVAAVSYLTNDELNSDTYSEFYSRKKVEGLMKEAGIRGPKNGKDFLTGKQKYYGIKLESERREVYPLIISDPIEMEKKFSTSLDAYLSQANHWILDFSGMIV